MYDDGYTQALAQKVKVEILDKRHKGDVYNITYFLEDDYNTRLPQYEPLKINDKVCVYANFENGVLSGDAYIQYYDKTGWIYLILVIFALAIVLIGGTKGIKALVGLMITVALVFCVLIPGILDGKEPILLTIAVSSIIIFITFLIVSGIHKKTLAAIIGTIAGVVAAGVIGMVFSNLMMLSGINEHARMLSVAVSEEQKMFDFRGIMLAGIMISALGACMDVGMSIASSVSELKKENPDMTPTKLIKSGMNIGRDVMGTMTNTLILAYVGSSLLVILLLKGLEFETYQIINNTELVLEEVLRAMAGSFGLVATIPITTVISAFLMGASRDSEQKLLTGDRDFTYTKKECKNLWILRKKKDL